MSALLAFLEQYSRQFGYAYGIQRVSEVSARLKLAGESLLTQALTPVERLAFDRFVVQKRRDEWLAGRLAAKEAFYCLGSLKHGGWSAAEWQPISVLNQVSRAPYIAEQPNLRLSISHSHDYAIAVIAPFPIGVDLEKIEPRHPALLEYFFSPPERDWLVNEKASAGEPADCRQELTRQDELVTWLWTRKEALSKYLQLGGSLAFSQVNVVNEEVNLPGSTMPAARLVSGRLSEGGAPASYCVSCALPVGRLAWNVDRLL